MAGAEYVGTTGICACGVPALEAAHPRSGISGAKRRATAQTA
jgi:hypothetical protein